MPRQKSILAGIKEQIAEAVEGKRFCEVREMVSQLTKAGIFNDEFDVIAARYLKSELVRQVMRRKGDDGYPLFPNISTTDPTTGKKTRVYMREKYMKPPQYRQVADEWIARENYGRLMANETIMRCNNRYHTQFELPFPDQSEAA